MADDFAVTWEDFSAGEVLDIEVAPRRHGLMLAISCTGWWTREQMLGLRREVSMIAQRTCGGDIGECEGRPAHDVILSPESRPVSDHEQCLLNFVVLFSCKPGRLRQEDLRALGALISPAIFGRMLPEHAKE